MASNQDNWGTGGVGGRGGAGVVIVRYQGASLGSIGGTVTTGAAASRLITGTGGIVINRDFTSFNLTNAPGNLTLSSGTLEFFVIGSGSSAGGTIVNDGVVSCGASVPSVPYSISGSGRLETKNYSLGILTLTGNSTFSGPTIVRIYSGTPAIGDGGTSGSLTGDVLLGEIDQTVIFNRSDDSTYPGNIQPFPANPGVIGTGPVNVLSGAILGGTGTISGSTSIAGIHAPGSNAPGVQTLTDDLTYAVGAAVEWELAANTSGGAGTNEDQIAMPTGNLAFSGSTTLDLSFNGVGSTVDWANAFWNSDRAWAIFDVGAGTTTGFENLVVGGSLLDSLGNTLSAERGAFSTSQIGQDVYLNYTAAAVPEPATLALALGGLACGGYTTWRRRRRDSRRIM